MILIILEIIIITSHSSYQVLGDENVYRNFFRKISNSNGVSNSFLMNSVWNALSTIEDVDMENVCLKDLKLFEESYIRGTIWALRMLDATSNFHSGFLQGNIINLGDFKQCLAIVERSPHVKKQFNDSEGEYHKSAKDYHRNGEKHHNIRKQYHVMKEQHNNMGEQYHNIRGQYCMVTFFTPQSKFAPFVTQHYNIQSALCVPSSCTVHNITAILKNGLLELGRQMYFSVDDCETSKSLEPKIGAVEITILVFLVLLGSTLFIATVTDILMCYGHSKLQFYVENSNKYTQLQGIQQIFLMFSLRLNVRSIFKVDTKKNSIGCLHGLRFISACMILSIHRLITDPQPFTNLFMLDNEVRKWDKLFQMNAYLFVDVFFLISGLLVSYNSARIQKMNVLQSFIHRYLRLTPPLLACIFLTILLDMVCDGPYCNSINRLSKEQCLNNSVYNLLYISNLVNSSESCLPHTWYLAADMQLYCISFLLLIIARKQPQHIFKLLAAYWLLSVIITFVVSYVNQIHAGFIGTTHSYEIDSLLLYEQFYMRAGPWVIGFALGLLLKDSKKLQLKKAEMKMGWTLTLICLSISYFGVYPFVQYGFEHGAIVDSLYNTFSHSIFALAVGWIIYACQKGHGGFVNSFLSSILFQRLSKMTYCFYLVHPLVQALQYSQIVSPRTYSDLSQISLLLGDVLYSLMFAAILYVAVEAPVANIENRLLEKSIQGKQNSE
ncbi:nose resistant to fluoxetine protein 6-like [Nilaparvata lugens]|uniref:nose resistant to fluoxetine protein 6-like n=1 Tax=Nilaparvata lugens TaxID=108931 RepID=UPI00193DAE6F|nr:nose resistant to fluoxetine protein 6-like [Nilaparvata lugens]